MSRTPSLREMNRRRIELGLPTAPPIRTETPALAARGPRRNPHGLAPSGANRAARRRR